MQIDEPIDVEVAPTPSFPVADVDFYGATFQAFFLSRAGDKRGHISRVAECCETLASIAEETDTADRAVGEQLQIRQRLAETEGEKVPAMVDLLAAEWQAADLSGDSTEVASQLGKLAEIERQLLANWPTSPAEIYEAACRLTLRRASLLEAVSPAEPRP